MLLALWHILRGCRYEKNEGIVGSNSQASIIHAWDNVTQGSVSVSAHGDKDKKPDQIFPWRSHGRWQDTPFELENSTIIAKTKLFMVSCSLCSLSVGSCLLAAVLSASFPQKALCSLPRKPYAHWLNTPLELFCSFHSPLFLLLWFSHIGE